MKTYETIAPVNKVREQQKEEFNFEALKDRGVQLVGITSEDASTVRDFLDRRHGKCR